MEDHNHIVYMLKCDDDTLYTGCTTNIEHSLKMHKEGKESKTTRGKGPFQVVFIEKHPTKELALQRESEVKQLSRRDKVLLIREQLKDVINNENSEEL